MPPLRLGKSEVDLSHCKMVIRVRHEIVEIVTLKFITAALYANSGPQRISGIGNTW